MRNERAEASLRMTTVVVAITSLSEATNALRSSLSVSDRETRTPTRVRSKRLSLMTFPRLRVS